MITESQMRNNMFAIIEMAVEELSDEELAVLNIVAQTGQDPKGRLFDYEKVRHLFNQDNGTKMHDEIKLALVQVANMRLAK